MAKFLSNINLETANDLQFKTTAGTNAGKISQTGNDLVLSNPVGDILLGDGASDVYIGDGTNNVDILFEQSGNIKADDSASSVTLTLGSSNTTLSLVSPTITGTITDSTNSLAFLGTAQTFTGQKFFDAGFDAHPIMLSGSQNFDNIDRSGFYNLYNASSGSTNPPPNGAYGTMFVIGNDKQSQGFGVQLFHQRTGGAGQLQVRGMNDTASAWSSWNTVYTSADTATIADGGTGIATADQIHTFVTGFNYSTATGVEDNADVTDATNVASAGAAMDGDFTSEGLMKRGSSAGSYSIVTDSSTNWNTAYGWGDHSTQGYLTSSSTQTKYLRSDENDTTTGVLTVAGLTGNNTTGTHGGNDIYTLNMPQNPEGRHVKAPWFFNDMAYARLRGAAVSATVDGTDATDSNKDKLFDASTGFWSVSTSGVTSVVVTIGDGTNDLPKTFQHGTHIGVTFGNSNWRANTVKIETYRSNSWNEEEEFTSNSKEMLVKSINHSGDTISRIRYTFSNFNTTSMRIVSLFAYNYNATGMPSLYLTKDGGEMYGDIDMGTNTITDTKVGQWDTAYTHSQATHAPTNADNTAANETSHSDVLVDGDFTGQGFMKRGSSSGSYSIDTNTYITGYTVTTSDVKTALNADLGGSMTIGDSNDTITFGEDVVVTGDLTVNGSTVTVDTTNLNVQDKNITLNYSTGDSSASADGAGITIQDAVDASNNATMLWTASTDKFAFSHDIVANGVTLTGDQTLPPDLTVDGAGTVHANNYTNTQYSTVSTSAAGLAPQLPSSHGGKFLRADGSYAVPSYTTETYTAHESISAATSVNGSGRQYIQDITVDGNGHVTGIATATETVVNTDTNKFLSGITKPANSNALQFAVTNGSTVSFTFGSNAYNSTTIPTGNAAIDWSVSGEEAVIHSSYYTNTVYTHPTYSTTNINTSGSTIVDSITTNSTGHITAMGTRTLALSDLGFSGNSAANCVLNASQTLTNKTIDADDNTISDLVVSNFKASAVVIESEGISSNDNDTTIPTSAAVKDYVDSAVIADTDTQDLSISGDTISLDRGGSVDVSTATAVAANTAKTSFPGFGTSNTTALRGDTSIPSISGLATTTYVDTAETDAIAAAATAAASLYVPNSGTTTISGTKTITGSLILDDGTGASPTMRFMNEDDDEVSIFCNTTGKMKFQQKLVGGSNVVQMTMDENGLDIENGLTVGTGATITTILDEDDMTSNSATALATQQSIKAYVTSAVAGAGGGTMSSWNLDSDANSAGTINQGTTVSIDGGTGISTSRAGAVITIDNDITNNNQLTNGAGYTTNTGTTTAGNTQTFTNKSGNISQWTNDSGYTTNAGTTTASNTQTFTNKSGNISQWTNDSSYLTSVATSNIGDNAVTMAKIKDLATGRLIVGSINNGGTTELATGTSGQVLTVQSNSTLAWETPSSGSSYSLPTSSTSTLGGVKLGSDTALTQTYNAGGAGSSSRTYPVQLNSSNQMGVSVPWSNTNTTYSAGTLLNLSSTTFNVDLTDATAATIAAGDNIIFIDGGATGTQSKGSINDVATLFAGGGLSATSGVLSVNLGHGLGLDVDTIKITPGNNITTDANGIHVSTDIQTTTQRIGRSGTNGMTLDFTATDGCVFETNASTPVTVLTIGTDTNATLVGTFLASNVTSNSDERVKKDIEDIPSYKALEVIKEVKGVRYNWKEKHEDGEFPEYHKDKPKNGLKEIGFIAQDLEKILPELVEEVSSDNDFKSVNYAKMVVVLTEAMKEQQNQIEKLQKQLNKLL